jgi:hypothetical protein
MYSYIARKQRVHTLLRLWRFQLRLARVFRGVRPGWLPVNQGQADEFLEDARKFASTL